MKTTRIRTSTGLTYDLSPAEQAWVTSFGEQSDLAMLCIRHALVYALRSEEWLTDVCLADAVYLAQNADLSYRGEMPLIECCRAIIKRFDTDMEGYSVFVELARMPDGTPCSLLNWRAPLLGQGLGRPSTWVKPAINSEGLINSVRSGFCPSVLVLDRSGIYPGISLDRLETETGFRQLKLPRENGYVFFLFGVADDENMKHAEELLAAKLEAFEGSALAIVNSIDPDDPDLLKELYSRDINSLPHMIVTKDDDTYLRMDGPFTDEGLTMALDERFLPPVAPQKNQISLCADCLERYKSLPYDMDAKYSLSILPELSTLVWRDEHPDGMMNTVNHNRDCSDCLYCLITARNHIWKTGSVSSRHLRFWNDALRLMPDWPGFKRLTLTLDQIDSYYHCRQEAQDIRDMLIDRGAETHYRCIAPGFVKWAFVLRPDPNNMN